MSSNDDPLGTGGKTIIRPGRGQVHKATPREPAAVPGRGMPDAPDAAHATIIDNRIVGPPPGGQPSETMIYQGIPFGHGIGTESSLSDDDARQTSSGSARTMPAGFPLDAHDGIDYSSDNPIVAAAAALLMLFGHLRLKIVSADPATLAAHVGRAIEEFERKIAKSGVPEQDVRIAVFALCETADDIIRNLPGFNDVAWKEHSMVWRFFDVESDGAEFFEALNACLADPETHCDLLELMHACLSFGFEGPFRGSGSLDSSPERIRADVFETISYFRVREDDEISPRWKGLPAMSALRPQRVPVWSVAAAATALLVGTFFALRTIITGEGDALAARLLALLPRTPVVIERTGPLPSIEEPAVEVEQQVVQVKIATSQIDRIRERLANQIGSGGLTVDMKGEFIVVGINNLLLFESGRADVKGEFDPLADSIAGALDPEPGPIRIVGHTDNVKPRASSAFKSNFDLSVARAQAVEKVIAPKFSEPTRITTEGKGDDEPIAGNDTPEGRARNRRVELLIPREEQL